MMYMNEDTKRKINSTQAITDRIDDLIEVFVTYYGEENRERITSKFKNVIVAGHLSLKGMERVINHDENRYIEELKKEFFEKIKNSPLYREDKCKMYLYSDTFKYYELQPITAYIKAISGERYYENCLNNFMNAFLPDKKFSEITKEDSIELDKVVSLYLEIISKYNAYLKETTEYREYIDKMKKYSDSLNYKYRMEFIRELKDYFTDDEYNKIINGENCDKLKNIFNYKIDFATVIDAFSSEKEEQLKNGKSAWVINSIKEDRIKYFNNLGINLGDDYNNYLENDMCKKYFPSLEFVTKVVNLRKKYIDKKDYEFYSNYLEYRVVVDQIDNSFLLDKKGGYGVSAYTENMTCVYPNIKRKDDSYQIYPILSVSIDGLEEYLDHFLIHELNHIYELNLLNVSNDGYQIITGFDKFSCSFDNSDDTDEVRDYELFNEIINEIIAQDITKILFDREQYIFNNKENAKYKNGSSYEKMRVLVQDFFDKYKKEIIESRRLGDLSILTDKVGLDNFNNLNNLLIKFNDYFPGLSFGSAVMDYKKGLDTELSRKLIEIINERNKIFTDMDEYDNSYRKSI